MVALITKIQLFHVQNIRSYYIPESSTAFLAEQFMNINIYILLSQLLYTREKRVHDRSTLAPKLRRVFSLYPPAGTLYFSNMPPFII